MTVRPLRIVEILTVLALVGFLLFAALTLADFVADSSAYRFGTEVSGWAYRSPGHYLGVSAAQLALPIIGLAAGLLTRRTAFRRSIRGGILALSLAVLVLL